MNQSITDALASTGHDEILSAVIGGHNSREFEAAINAALGQIDPRRIVDIQTLVSLSAFVCVIFYTGIEASND